MMEAHFKEVVIIRGSKGKEVSLVGGSIKDAVHLVCPAGMITGVLLNAVANSGMERTSVI